MYTNVVMCTGTYCLNYVFFVIYYFYRLVLYSRKIPEYYFEFSTKHIYISWTNIILCCLLYRRAVQTHGLSNTYMVTSRKERRDFLCRNLLFSIVGTYIIINLATRGLTIFESSSVYREVIRVYKDSPSPPPKLIPIYTTVWETLVIICLSYHQINLNIENWSIPTVYSYHYLLVYHCPYYCFIIYYLFKTY